jgi:outer membrane lipoprotein carrier protein
MLDSHPMCDMVTAMSLNPHSTGTREMLRGTLGWTSLRRANRGWSDRHLRYGASVRPASCGPRRLHAIPAVLLVLGLLLFAPLTFAGDARAALERFLDGLETYSAEFSQTLTDETDFLLQEARGRLALALPDRMRWEVDAPFEQWIVADGDQLWTYDPELRQATVRPVDQALDSTPLALLTQPHRLDERFDVSEEPVAEGLRLVLHPRSRQADFSRLELDLSRDGELLGFGFMDVFGQRTEIRLREPRRNPSLSPAEFQFNPPPGTDVYRP